MSRFIARREFIAVMGAGAAGLVFPTIVAVAGLAVGYYACGGGAWGKHVLSATQRSPEALDLFGPWLPWK